MTTTVDNRDETTTTTRRFSASVHVIRTTGGLERVIKRTGATSPTVQRCRAVQQRVSHPRALVGDPLPDQSGLTMPFIASPSLDRAPPGCDLHALLDQALDLLEHLHARGVVHRDIKPANLISHEAELFLIDFGSAVCHPCPVGSPEGSPAYMAPEVLLEWSMDPSVDLWALMTTLYELRTGRLPFDHGTLAIDLHHKQAGGSWAPVEGPGAGWWNTLFTKGFAPHPADRWSVAQIRDHLVSAVAPLRGVSSANRSATA